LRREVRDGWDSETVASRFDQDRFGGVVGRLRAYLESSAARRALRGIPAGAPALDLACGTGRISSLLLRRGHRVVGADVSGEMLGVAARRLAEGEGLVGLVRCDANHLPFPDRFFPLVTCIRLLGHLDRKERGLLLREAARVSSGTLLVDLSIPTPLTRLGKRLTRWLRRPVTARGQWSWHELDSRALEEEAREAGFQVRRTRRKLPVLSDGVFALLVKDSESGPDG
jgi:ubiquinone/menaquinone biosynthesis C-methylase UbiE